MSDGVLLTFAFALAFWLRFETGVAVFQTEFTGNVDFYTRMVFSIIPLWIGVFLAVGLYREHNLLGGTREYALVFNGVSVGMMMVVFLTFLQPNLVIARGWLLVAWIAAFVLVSGARFAMRRAVYQLRQRGYFLAPTIIVGTNAEALALGAQLQAWRTSGLHVLGFVGQEMEIERVGGQLPHLGQTRELPAIVARHGVEEIVVATSAVSRAELVDLFRRFAPEEGVQLRLSSGIFEVITTGLEVRQLAYVPLINVQPVRLTGIDTLLKAALDYSVALAVVILGAPLYLLLAIAVRLDSPGPILHRRRVLGLGGREFDALKFRSMRLEGDAILTEHPELLRELEANHKLRDDPRVTRVGRVLRKLSLDELPQAFNVLLGQMSIVGPRMISPAEHSRYGQWDMNLLTVKPGITGLWQVSGRSDVSYDERVQLDMSYIRNWTIWLDLQILLQTIPAVLGRRGAY